MLPTDPPLNRTAVVIANPHARRAIPLDVLDAAADAMCAHGWRVEIEVTSDRQDARARAEHHARAGVGALLACGGDGSLLPLLDGVRAAEDTPTAVGVIPAGTADVWAAEARIPRDPTRALALLEHGERRRVDLGVARIGEGAPVRFLLVCGVGIDAAVVEAVERRPDWKRRLGRAAFALPSLTALAAWRAVDTRVEYDGVEERAPQLLLALATNAGRYGGVAALAQHTAFDDGLLEVTTFEGNSLASRGALVLQALRGHLDERAVQGVRHRQAARVTITPSRALPVEVDGESIGRCGPDTPLHIEVEPRAVTMIFGAGS